MNTTSGLVSPDNHDFSTAEEIGTAKILLASLSEQHERRESVRANIGSKVPFAFVECVDGRGWGDEETDSFLSDRMRDIRAKAQQEGKTWLASGAVACAVTHRDNLIGSVTEPGKILCEDDVIFQQDFLDKLADDSGMEALASVGGIVLLNYRSRHPIRAEKKPAATFGRYSIHRVESDNLASAAAYFLTPAVAEKIRSFQTPLQVPVDSWGGMKNGGAIDQVYVVHPSPAQTGHFASTINYGRKRGSSLIEFIRQIGWLRTLRWRLLRAQGKSHMKVTEWI